jgi:hypothetical protein
MAVLIFTPLILKWFAVPEAARSEKISFKRSVEAVLLFGGLAGFLWYLLVLGGGINAPKIPVLIFILWAGLRFGLRGASLAIFFAGGAVGFFHDALFKRAFGAGNFFGRICFHVAGVCGDVRARGVGAGDCLGRARPDTDKTARQRKPLPQLDRGRF